MRAIKFITITEQVPFYAFFIAALFLLFVSRCDATELTLNTTGSPPLNTPKQTGFMDLIATEAFHRIGITLKTIKLPAERGLINANVGIVDGEMSRIKGLEKLYPNLIRVPEKIMDWDFVGFSQKDIDLTHGWSSLPPYSVSFINGWKILEKDIPKRVDITKVRTPEQLFSILYKKRTDLILYERWGGLLYIKNKHFKSIKILSPPLATKEMFIYLHKKHKLLVPKLAKALKQIKQNGRYTTIFNKILMPLK